MIRSDRLADPEFWESPGIDLRIAPRHAPEDAAGLERTVREELGVDSAVVVATSGSQGRPKYAVLEKRALLASAAAVNRHCGLGAEDCWLGGLSTFHVGGLAIFARAFLSGARVVAMPWDQWERDGRRFVEMCYANWISVTSLTPVHLHDLVSHRVPCPESLRGVFVGGGALSPVLAARARALGWPVWTTYGMTEACSQVATCLEDEDLWLPVLPHWEVRGGDGSRPGRLSLRGEALFSGYVVDDDAGGWRVERPFDDEGWFESGDLCRIKGEVLRFAGRADDLVKVLGELVSVGRVERLLGDALDGVGASAAVLALPHERKGNELVAFVEGGEEAKRAAWKFASEQPALERFSRVEAVEELPRTEVGKIDRGVLREKFLSSKD